MKLDKFYTKEKVALECIHTTDKILNLSRLNVVEPSCGDGVFSKNLPAHTISLDIAPEYEDAIEMDFYNYTPEFGGDILVIGNPPFGSVGKEAVKFFNKASEFSSYIAFIVPRTFKRISVQNRLSLDFHLIYEKDIPIGSFIPETMRARCVFQIWERRKYKRSKVILPSTHPDFKITKDVYKANIAIKAYGGSGDCGKMEYRFDNLNPKAYHFIVCGDEVIDIFKNIQYYPLASDTVRQDSIGQKELIYLYTKYKEEII